MSIDVESIIYKTYQYFCIYTVLTEELKNYCKFVEIEYVCTEESMDYCKFVEIEYQKLLSSCVTKWLSLYPSLSRRFQMYPALQSYFISIDKPPVVLKWFYESTVNKLYLKHLQSFVVIFYEQVQNIERSTASTTEVKACLDAVKSTIEERQKQLFISTQIKSKLSKLREDGHDHECDLFISDVSALYESCVVNT